LHNLGSHGIQIDEENRLTQINYADGTSSKFVYDGAGKRVKLQELNALGMTDSETKFLPTL
jgi:hypothetical protein